MPEEGLFLKNFYLLLALYRLKENKNPVKNKYPMIETSEIVDWIEKLPYKLTNAQTKVWTEVSNELTGDITMESYDSG